MKSSKRMKTFQPSSQLSAKSDYSYRSLINSHLDFWHDSGYGRTISAVFFAEPFLQFLILHRDHYRAGHDCKCGQCPTNCDARANAPGEHYAEMGQVDRMAHAGANARRHQALFAVVA